MHKLLQIPSIAGDTSKMEDYLKKHADYHITQWIRDDANKKFR